MFLAQTIIRFVKRNIGEGVSNEGEIFKNAQIDALIHFDFECCIY